MGIPGGVPMQRPDQLLQPRSRAGSGPAPQQTAFVGRIVITFGPTGAATGVFVYNPTIALGNLADSMTEATVGPKGETVAGQTLEQGITSYSPPSDPSRPGVFVQLHHGQVNFGDPLSVDPSTFTADMGVFHENTTGGPPILFINSGAFDAAGTHSNIWLIGKPLGGATTETINLFGVTAAGAITGTTLVNVVGALVMGTSGGGLPVATGPTLLRGTATQLLLALSAAATSSSSALMEMQGGTAQPVVQLVADASNTQAINTKVSGDANNRLQMRADGLLNWGSGAAPADSSMSRGGANLLNVSTADFAVHTAGRGLRVAQGANAKQGTATLAAGTVVVANTSVTASSIIVPGYQAPSANAGAVFCSSITAGTGFTLKSTNAADTSVVGYQIFEPG